MAKSRDYQKRFYREWTGPSDLVRQEVIVGETDIFISSKKDVKDIAQRLVKKFRGEIKAYIKLHPQFKTSLEPLDIDPYAPAIIKDMLRASISAGVGPMASVAGAVAEFTGKGLLASSGEIIIENGGDIFIKSDTERTVSIYAGASPVTNKLFIRIKPEDTPLGICTSSGTVGHSLSFGKADACVIISKSTSLADAVATAACNRVKRKGNIGPALEFAVSIDGVQGALIVYKKDFGASGNIELM
ncbi:MAG: UPF0280 family protein [Candidatus Omnitrophica bacterium]|nr:UPF0280 family protein [Candidatus Omnitrophota bacterium]